MVLGIGVAAQAAKRAEPIFIPPKEKIEAPFTNDKCLKNCHGEPELYSGSATGEKRHLFVDVEGYVFSVHGKKGIWCIDCHHGADPNVHPREGYPKADCRACHSHRDPTSYFPKTALSRIKEKEIEPPRNEFLKGDIWNESKHGWAYNNNRVGSPFCSDCHTAHYVRPTDDPASAVHEDNLAETCGSCHEPQVRNYSVGGALARWRLGGHGKGDISESYTNKRCLACHQGQAAHGEEEITDQKCPYCHNPQVAVEKGELSFHLSADPEGEYPTRIIALLYQAGIWLGGLGALALVLVYCFVTLYRKRDDE
jgi:Zn finger protein HypA/HybF involved in hydrogenase expression